MYNPSRNGSNTRVHCPAYRAFFRLTEDKRVRVYFLKRSLPTEIHIRHFGKGYFEINCPFDLPSVVLKKLGIDFYRINPGVYRVQEDSEFVQVVF